MEKTISGMMGKGAVKHNTRAFTAKNVDKERDLGRLERMKELCKERNNLYEKQNDLKGQKYKIEKLLER